MKSLAIIGMMFLSMGLFAQQSSSIEKQEKQKDPVCVKKCEKAQKCDKMVKAPIREVDARKTSVRAGNVNTGPKHRNGKAAKAHVQNRRMLVPLRKKDAKVDARM